VDELRIANDDAMCMYGDLSDLEISIRLQPAGWHVKYRPANPEEQGGSPHYVIDGNIKSKKYYQ
jgi:hypothetical protein